MGDYERGTPFAEPVKRFGYTGLGSGIECACSFVEYEYRRVFEEYTRDGYALLLTARKRYAAFTNDSIVAVRHSHDIVVYFCSLCGGDYLIVGCACAPVPYVFAYCVGEEENILLDYAYVSSKRVERYRSDIASVYQNGAARWFIKAGYELAERRFAAA